MKSIARHSGFVTKVEPGKVWVKIQTLSACGSCEAHASCGFAESRDREVEIDCNAWKSYAEGDNVVVSVNHSLGFQAVALAYILPSLVLLAVVIVLLNLMDSEPLAVLISLCSLVLYYVVLYQFRNKLQKRFTFGIEKAE